MESSMKKSPQEDTQQQTQTPQQSQQAKPLFDQELSCPRSVKLKAPVERMGRTIH